MRKKIDPFPPGGPTKPKPDLNKGANMLRGRIVAYLQRSLKQLEAKHGKGTLPTLGVKRALHFVQTTDERAARKAGGLGRR